MTPLPLAPTRASRLRTLLTAGLVTLLLFPLVAPPAQAQASTPTLDPPTNEPLDLMYEPGVRVQEMYRALEIGFGIRVLFDPKLRDIESGRPVLREVDLFEALDALITSHGHFYKVLDPTTVLIADDTPQNRRQYDEQAIQTFYLENTRVADGMTVLRSMLGLKHVAAQEANRTLTVRDTTDTVALAADLLASIDVPAAEVELELVVIEVAPEDLESLLDKDRPQRLNATQRQRLLDRGTVVERSQVAAVEGHRARLELEEHFPIPYGDSASSRLGIHLRTTPRVHTTADEISLELGLDVHAVTAWVGTGASNPAPVLGNRHLDSTVRLSEGSTWLVRGFFAGSAGQAPAGFEHLPPLSRWLTGQLPEGREMVLALTPRVVRGPGHTAKHLAPRRIGTETRVVYPDNRPAAD